MMSLIIGMPFLISPMSRVIGPRLFRRP